MHGLIVTCRLPDRPYDYLVDVLQRVGRHPAGRVHELTPRMSKATFAVKPLRSAAHEASVQARTPAGYRLSPYTINVMNRDFPLELYPDG